MMLMIKDLQEQGDGKSEPTQSFKGSFNSRRPETPAAVQRAETMPIQQPSAVAMLLEGSKKKPQEASAK